ncbi:hypothetical protein AW909_15495 [Pseudomonas aeruginosa]|nr:hypothetical protein AN453_12545 [Pseudomonas aeruginosa]KXD59397.1 hypothetical protein AW909_15495 [Pseudomonas aeruginosa]KXD60178.1 hypothetical protein AW908_15345 [Pseudomonas aeruginosa]KXD62596.1 hypothetical protein AW910_15925 [Pseudomonas aeruginosa]KXD74830.1 hypothetical protein AW911_15505 [Pseudomonas aeruginosa]
MPHAALLLPPSASPLPEVVGFWRDAGPTLWFARNADFDRRFRERFAHLYELACANALRPAADEAEDHLGLLLLLDQYPRNAFRGTPRMYASDAQARRWAERALGQGLDRQVGDALRLFFYLPFAHAENLADQDRSVALNHGLGQPFLAHAREHREIIRRFGRFPHRNPILGRPSSAEELAFLAAGGFAG